LVPGSKNTSGGALGFTIRQSCTIILWRYLGTHAMENSQIGYKIAIGNR